MIALVFLYWTASIFIYGGELNSAISRHFGMGAKATDPFAGATSAGRRTDGTR